MLNSLVTGGAGFIGSHVAQHLLDMGHMVVILDDLSGGFEENIPNGSEFITGSILDREKIESLFKKYHFDFVFHLAAYAAEGLSHFIKHFNYQNNVIGSINLINASVTHDVECFVFMSSIAVYGSTALPMVAATPALKATSLFSRTPCHGSVGQPSERRPPAPALPPAPRTGRASWPGSIARLRSPPEAPLPGYRPPARRAGPHESR